MSFQYLNTPPIIPSPEGVFSFSVPAKTDIWRKPPTLDVFSAPVAYRKIPIQQFRRARVTVSGDWRTLYDQGGLVIILPQSQHGYDTSNTHKRWVKAGVEFHDNSPKVSVVSADSWADWSLLPVGKSDTEQDDAITIVCERECNSDGTFGAGLHVYLAGVNGEKKIMIREVTWPFFGVGEDDTVDVGIYAARPTPDERESLTVKLKDFVIELV
ncbi:hypothetical protein BGW36DRAFT_373098 [Talaromyces proteolyticus]|uniref:Uncharacterized protein n=1 Tax=Talaromyces proteolyticus TaxID=1131652 RepID=A0AAD4KWP8_9EURO|nr:uncharacterized protein BGW36DRAFT_373098 [Talaromyces proteolyticus]KAH8702568.1 hypothetical protein BGW36DRAFT_373098 [Talaromyces proteolyticus]